ncbi:hypothetical protein ABMA27_012896 [Loxostege sticticalis]|uniref:Reverse transcriptase domain-containing protein n=1 Tax=Loxostege sticticalis TaxID=481309 RepID=A0ABR3H072_LOXSC
MSYLENRTQLVAVKGFTSAPISATSGVPQGSHLGPLFFVVFINDLPNRLSSQALLYADDLKIFTRVDDVSQCLALQKDLNVVVEWCSDNKMSLNVDKCCAVSFTAKKTKLTYTYNILDKPLCRKETIRDLGVLFDEQLTFRPHYDQIVKKGNRLLGFIMRTTKDFKKPKSTLCLFYSFVRSVLEYCCPIWSPFYRNHADNLERIQKRCLRYLSRKHNYGRALNNYGERLIKFDVMPLETRRKRYDLLYLHKILHFTVDAPGLLSAINVNIRHRSRNPNTFDIQVYRNNTSYYNPLVRMCRTYNELSRGGKDIDIFNSNFSQYKKAISNTLKAEVISP